MKKYLNNLFAVAFVAVMAMFTSCSEDYQADIDSLSDRVSALESTVDDLNDQISAGAVITSVTSTTSGCTFTLSNGNTYTVTNGEDATGESGTVVTFDDDGQLLIDDVESGYYASATAGADTDTDTDTDTEVAEYFYFKPVDGVFYYCSNLVPDGVATEYTYSTACNVVVVDNDNGTYTLTVDGTSFTIGLVEITSLLAGEAIEYGFVFESGDNMPYVTPYALVNSKTGVTLLTSYEEFGYIVNPSNATAPAAWNVNVIDVATKASEGLFYGAVTYENGVATVKGKFDVANLAPEANTESRFYLDAVLSDGETVSSNTAIVKPILFSEVFIGNTTLNENYKTAASASDDYDATDYLNAEARNGYDFILYANGTVDTAFDLDTLVYASAQVGRQTRMWLDAMGITDYSFEFSIEDEFISSETNNANQQEYVSLSDENVLTVAKGSSSYDKLPRVKVELFADETFSAQTKALATVYIQFLIEDEIVLPAEELEDVEFEYTIDAIDYADLYTSDVLEISTDQATMDDVYDELGISYAQFKQYYKVFEEETGYEGYWGWLNYTGVSISTSEGCYAELDCTSMYESLSSNTTPVTYHTVNILPTTEIGTHTITVSYPSRDNTLYPNIDFVYTVTIIAPEEALPSFTPVYVDADSVQVTKGAEFSGVYEMKVAPAEAFVDFLDTYKVTEATILAKYGNKVKFTFTKTDAAAATTSTLTNSDATTVAGLQNQYLMLNSAITVASLDVAMNFVITYENGYTQKLPWTITFNNPLSINTVDIELETLDITSYSEHTYGYAEFLFKDKVAKTYGGATSTLGSWDSTLKSTYGLSGSPREEVSTTLKTVSVEANHIISWNNEGSDLLEDTVVGYVEYTYNATSGNKTYATATAKSTVTVLK